MGGERFVGARGECTREAIGAPSMLRLILRVVALAKKLPSQESLIEY
jgi:hypothetical protein